MTDKELSTLKLFGEYDQKTLAALWGYKSYDAIRRGIVTPANSNIIILFAKVCQHSQGEIRIFCGNFQGNNKKTP